MRKIYRLKHIPTGLYWVKRGYGCLSENGSVFSSGCNSFCGMRPDYELDLRITDNKLINKYWDVLSKIGELNKHPKTVWDSKALKFVQTDENYYIWHMRSKVSDFEKEYVTVSTNKAEKSTDTNQELIKKIADICWNHRVNPDIETFEEWLNLIQDELKKQ